MSIGAGGLASYLC